MAGFVVVEVEGREESWSTANWYFRAFMDHVIRLLEDEPQTQFLAMSAEAHQIVNLRRVSSSEARKLLLDTMLQVCNLVEAGQLRASTDGRPMDDESQKPFRRTIRGLQALLLAAAK